MSPVILSNTALLTMTASTATTTMPLPAPVTSASTTTRTGYPAIATLPEPLVLRHAIKYIFPPN